jgi:hypothetical protein
VSLKGRQYPLVVRDCELREVFKGDSTITDHRVYNDPKPLCKDHHCFGVFLKLFLSEVFRQTLC